MSKKDKRKIEDKSVVKWTFTFVLTFGVILGLWRMSGAALGIGGDAPFLGTPTVAPTYTASPTVTDTPMPTEDTVPTPMEDTIPTPAGDTATTPTDSLVPTTTGLPTVTVAPTATPVPTDAADSLIPTDTPIPLDTTNPTNTPVPTATNTPIPTESTIPSDRAGVTPELAIKEIVATYTGDDRIVTNDVHREEIEAYVIYTWDSIEPEKIPASSLILKPGKVEKVGENVIEVWYDRYMTTITVNGLPRELVKFEAKYIGGPVYTGTEVDRTYIRAVATYNDGVREDVSDYVLLTTKINNTGVNALKITFGGMLDTIYVDGIVEEENRFKDYPIDSTETTRLTMLVSNEPYAGSIFVKTLDPMIVKNAVDRVVTTEKYIGFEVSYVDPEAINEFPIFARIIRPDNYDPEKFGVYYTTNRKSIMAKADGYYLDEEKKQYVFYIYEPGTYVMLEEISHKLVTSINVEKTVYKLKINRNISLLPVVLPATADNTDVTYETTDPTVAVVTKNGKVTTSGAGECDIIISACDESGIFTKVHIIVTE